MSKIKIIIVLLVVMALTSICIFKVKSKKNTILNKEINDIVTENIVKNNTIINNSIDENIESRESMDTTINVKINNKNYIATLEINETSKQFISMLPREFDMNELNGNEKYAYLDIELPTNTYNPKHIEAGDIMLFGNNCLVIFYKSFDTSYSYTKIGHIDGLNELGNENISIKFEK